MKDWEYYIKYYPRGGGAGGGPEDPRNILRKRRGDIDSNAQGLNRDGDWYQSWTLLDIAVGKGFAEADPVTREQAAAWARKWYANGSISKVPPDLA